jgi:hypothetical protein
MNMFLQKFASLIAEFPRERDSLARLGELVGTGVQRRFTLDHLLLRTLPDSEESFVRILERLVAMGTIGRVYEVESPTAHKPLEEYSSFVQIPESVFDVYVEQQIPVTPRNLRPLYLVK